MASFTDAISQFNPYIQQLPVELMAKVGMYKQAQYDAGVQKIQQQIDNVAGLDVYRPVDKQYLQSKLGELGNNLKVFAAGDFSNQQLVNSVAGMATSIAKDPVIQAATASSANIKNQESIINKIKSEKGHAALGAANLDAYNDQLLDYYKSTEPGKVFRDEYIPYTDVNKWSEDVAKSVGIDKFSYPDIYQRDENGNIIKDANGKAMVNKVMAEVKYAGKSPEKIINALENAMTPDIEQQIALDARYKLKHATTEDLLVGADRYFGDKVNKLEQSLEMAKIKLHGLETGESKDDAAISAYNEQVKLIENYLNKAKENRDFYVNANNVENNKEALKVTLYKDSLLDGAGNRFKEGGEDVTYKENIWNEVTRKENEFLLKLQTEDRQRREFNVLRQEHAADKAQDLAKWRADFFAENGYWPEEAGVSGKGPGIKQTVGPIDTTDPFVAKRSVENAQAADITTHKALSKTLALEYLRRVNPGKSDEQLLGSMKKLAANNHETLDNFEQRFAGKLLSDYDKNPGSVDALFVPYLKNFRALSTRIGARGEAMRSIEEKAFQEAKEEGLNVQEYKDLLKGISDKVVKVGQSGISVKIPKEDVILFAQLKPEFTNYFGSLTVDEDQKAQKLNAEKVLKAKYGSNYDKIYNQFYPTYLTETGTERAMPSTELFGKLHSNLRSSSISKVAKKVNQYYIDNGFISQPTLQTYTPPAKQKDQHKNAVIEVISAYGPGVNEDPAFDPAAWKTVLGGTDLHTTFEIKDVGGKNVIKMYGQSNKGSASAIISPDNYARITNQSAPQYLETDPLLLKLRATGTTMLKGGLPAFGSSDFSMLKNSKYKGVTGNLVTDKTNPNSIRLELRIPGKPGTYLFPDVNTYPEGAISFLSNGKVQTSLVQLPEVIDEATIDNLIKNKK